MGRQSHIQRASAERFPPPPLRSRRQRLTTALAGFLLPVVVLVGVGKASNDYARIQWDRDWEELQGTATGPIVPGEPWDVLPVRYRAGERTVGEPVRVVPLRPEDPQWREIRAAEAGDPVPLLRSRSNEQVQVSPHLRLSLENWIVGAAVLGPLNGIVLALVYRRRWAL
jgi:hypothetical protein